LRTRGSRCVDAIDGALARRLDVAARLPRWPATRSTGGRFHHLGVRPAYAVAAGGWCAVAAIPARHRHRGDRRRLYFADRA